MMSSSGDDASPKPTDRQRESGDAVAQSTPAKSKYVSFYPETGSRTPAEPSGAPTRRSSGHDTEGDDDYLDTKRGTEKSPLLGKKQESKRPTKWWQSVFCCWSFSKTKNNTLGDRGKHRLARLDKK